MFFNICPTVTIALKNIKSNYLSVNSIVNSKTVVSAVVKNDAYGLGAQKVSESLYEAGCRDFWVAYIKEAIDIRRILPLDANIYFLQGFDESCVDLIKTYKIIPVINSIEEFMQAKSRNIPMVLHFDTGLSRLGIRYTDIPEILKYLKNEKVQYIISHLACSDEKDSLQNIDQKNKFDAILNSVKAINPNIKAGISATGGTLLGNEFQYDIVRAGAFLYGINATEYSPIKPKNVFSLRTKVLQIYEIAPGISVGYSATFTATRKTRIAVLSIGYADGIRRSLSNKGCILFYDRDKNLYKANMIGNISMDLIACDITDIPIDTIKIKSEATMLNEDYSINEMAKDAGTIPYEILTNINFKSKRFKIEYI